jgi:hypothetical protein
VLKPPGGLVEGHIPRASTVLLYGESGICKSFTATGLAYSVATGRPWLGLEVMKGRAVYVAAEGSAGLGARSRAWKKANGFVGLAGVLFYPDVLNMGPVRGYEGLPQDVEQFILDLRPVKPTLVVIDTLARCLVGGDENSSRDMGYLVAAADRIRKELGATVLLVHHPGKSGQSERGSGALRAGVDTVIVMRRKGPLIEFECEKQKDAARFPTMYLRRKVVELDPGPSSCVVEAVKEHPSAVDELNQKQRSALTALASLGQAGGMSSTWRETTGLKERTFHNVRKRLLALKLVCGGGRLPFKLTATAKRLLKDRHGSTTSPTAATAPPLRGAGQVAVGKAGRGKKRIFSMRPERAEDGDED